MTIALLVLFSLLLIGSGALYAVSPGRPEPLRDADGRPIPGRISECVTVEIGGLPQG